jgi:hypothetical protein
MRPSLNRPDVAITLSLALAVAAYGAYLLLVGQLVNVVPEGGGAPAPQSVPTPAGLVSLAGGAAIIAGLLLERPVLAGAGALLTLLFSLLFLFGIGGVLVPVAVVLLALIAWITRRTEHEP